MTRVDDLTLHVRVFGLSLSVLALTGCGGDSGPGAASNMGGTQAASTSSPGQGGAGATTGGARNDTATGGASIASTSAAGGTTARSSSATGGSSGAGTSNTGGRVGSSGGAAAGGNEPIGTGGKLATGGKSAIGGAGTIAVGGTSSVVSSGGAQASGGAGVGGTSKGGATSSSTANGGSAGGGLTSSGGTSANGGTTTNTTGTTATDAVIIPDASWACGMASGIPSPTKGTLVFQATLDLAGIHDVGVTQYGHRRLLSINGGKFTGDRIQGSFLTGGLDLELTLSNGVIELEEINILKASDGTIIYVRSCGVAPAGESVVRFVPDFEVSTTSTYSWLNTGKFVGTRTVDASNKLQINVYDVSSVTGTTPSVQITKPAGGTNQPWDCSTVTGTKGNSVFTENVTLGSSISTGAAKRGTRNIIPITGGTTTGTVKGAILSGGADYQLAASGSTKLDARYTLAPSDGEFIVVRNCGPMGALIPQFEARADGPYKALNTPNGYLSSDPGSGSGGVSITFYERK